MSVIRQQLRALARRLRPAPPPPPPKPMQLWAIGMAAGPNPWQLAPAPTNPVLTREDVTDARAVFVADPFLHFFNGQWHMFFEVMNWHSGRGEIGLATSNDGLAWRYQQIVLAEPFHLSYPYVFAWRGHVYMMPECYQAGGVRLYQAESFPTGWRHVATLLEGPYFADCSPFHHGGRWWMLSEVSAGFACDTLRLYMADELTGPWREHPRSPIVSGDPLTARPAGRVLL
nr:hypothetical protein [Chloroflexaceae bacterium]